MSDEDSGEPGLARKLAAVGTELTGEVAKDAATQVVGAALAIPYMIVLAAGSLVVLVGALVVYIGGWAVTSLALSNVPGIGGLAAAFWGIVALVLLFLGIRWVVRRFGRPIEARADKAVANVHQAIDRRVAGLQSFDPVAAGAAPRPSVPAPDPTLAELDARLAPRDPQP